MTKEANCERTGRGRGVQTVPLAGGRGTWHVELPARTWGMCWLRVVLRKLVPFTARQSQLWGRSASFKYVCGRSDLLRQQRRIGSPSQQPPALHMAPHQHKSPQMQAPNPVVAREWVPLSHELLVVA